MEHSSNTVVVITQLCHHVNLASKHGTLPVTLLLLHPGSEFYVGCISRVTEVFAGTVISMSAQDSRFEWENQRVSIQSEHINKNTLMNTRGNFRIRGEVTLFYISMVFLSDSLTLNLHLMFSSTKAD